MHGIKFDQERLYHRPIVSTMTKYNGFQNLICVLHRMVNSNSYVRICVKNYKFLESMSGIFRISKEMLIEKRHLIAHLHKSRKRTIQSWIFIPPKKWAMISIHNVVKKMHKHYWGHNLNNGNFKV